MCTCVAGGGGGQKLEKTHAEINVKQDIDSAGTRDTASLSTPRRETRRRGQGPGGAMHGHDRVNGFFERTGNHGNKGFQTWMFARTNGRHPGPDMLAAEKLFVLVCPPGRSVSAITTSRGGRERVQQNTFFFLLMSRSCACLLLRMVGRFQRCTPPPYLLHAALIT